MLRQIRRLMATKVIKTPQMGESITEGTLTQWFKAVGDVIQADEQIATIETDKIDVQVNSPHTGIVEKLYHVEGDVVLVGNDLFSLKLDGDLSKIKPIVSDQNTEEKELQPAKMDSNVKETVSAQSGVGHRVPLIKFLGPRIKLWAQQIPNETKNISNPLHSELLTQLPLRFRPTPLSAAEIEAIDVLLINLAWIP